MILCLSMPMVVLLLLLPCSCALMSIVDNHAGDDGSSSSGPEVFSVLQYNVWNFDSSVENGGLPWKPDRVRIQRCPFVLLFGLLSNDDFPFSFAEFKLWSC